MPYFITDKADGCSGWATIKADGEIVGCHQSKAAAIKQMVAISLAEKIEPGGERALNDELEVGDFVFWENAGQTEYGLITLVSTYGVVTDQLGATVVATQDRPIAKISVYELVIDRLVGTDRFVVKSFAPLTKLEMPDRNDDNNDDLVDDPDDDMRIDVKVPAYMRAAARRGLEYVSEGKAGDGLKQQTINEARKMAAGEISDDKWIRMAAWIARHMGDLDSPEADPQHPNYPSAGVVAHLLWGSGPSKTKARAAMEFAQGVVDRIRKEEERHLPSKHDQSTHGKGGGNGNLSDGNAENKRAYKSHQPSGSMPDEKWAELNNEMDAKEALADVYEKYGYNSKPSVSDAEFNQLKNSGATIVYRGYSGGQMSAEDMTNDFRNGEKHYPGSGQWANGTYTSTSKETAIGYSQYGMMVGKPGAVIAMAIRPEAKFINYNDLSDKLNSLPDKESAALKLLDKSPSALAIHFGFDGIVRKTQAGDDHYIVLNRSAVVVPQGNE